MRASGDPIALRILTHNIRYATSRPGKGEKPWTIRCPRLCSELAFNTLSPDSTFICLQEVLHQQLLDILDTLNHAVEPGASWSYIGVGRDDGKQAGEYSPILYRPSVFKLEEWKTVWLSDHPNRPSLGWDAACIRIVTVGVFTHRLTHRKVVIMNTHLDHQGTVARAKSAKLILELVKNYESPSEPETAIPCYLAGDFNSPPDDEAYKIMTSENSSMVDVSEKIPISRRYGHEMTFTSFGEPGSSPSRIDFIFAGKSSKSTIRTFAVLENTFDDGVYISDHRAVVTDLIV